MSAHQEHNRLAMAAMSDQIGKGKALQAAVLRGDPDEEIERLRAEGVATAESYFDQMIAAAHAALSILKD